MADKFDSDYAFTLHWYRLVLPELNMVPVARLFLERVAPEKSYRYSTVGGSYRFDMCLYGTELDRFSTYLKNVGIDEKIVPMDNWMDWS